MTLNVPLLGRTLSVEVSPQDDALAPGESTTLDIVLKNASGEPVSGAELAVVVVDEAILALTNYQLADPISVFYYTRHPGLESTYGRSKPCQRLAAES